MPVQAVKLTDHLNKFIADMVQAGRHASQDEVIAVALERYQEDIAAELELAARIDAGVADMAALEAFLAHYHSRRSAPLVPVTREFMDRIEILVGPVNAIDIDLEMPVEGEADL